MSRPVLLFLLALVLAIGFLALADEAREQELSATDYAVRAAVVQTRSPSLDRVMRAVSLVGSGYVLIPLSLAFAGLMMSRRHPGPRFIVAIMAGSVVLEGVAKWVVHRPRPKGVGYGFPSGHTIAIAVFAGLLLYVISKTRMRWSAKAGASCLALLVVGGVAYSRLYLNAHWFTDVLGGVTGGGAYLCAAIGWLEQRMARRVSA